MAALQNHTSPGICTRFALQRPERIIGKTQISF